MENNSVYTKDITVFQLRAARRSLNLTVREVAKKTSLGPGVVVRSEAGDLYEFPGNSTVMSVTRLRAFYEQYGIVFLPGNAIRLNKSISDIIFRQKS